jgi:hypothetical protein
VLATTVSGGEGTYGDNKLTYQRDLEGRDGEEREKGEAERDLVSADSVELRRDRSQGRRRQRRAQARRAGECGLGCRVVWGLGQIT